MQGYYGSEAYQQSVLKRLAREVVPFGYPRGGGHEPVRLRVSARGGLRAHSLRAARYPRSRRRDRRPGDVRQHAAIAARDSATGWPCQVANEWTVFAKGKD